MARPRPLQKLSPAHHLFIANLVARPHNQAAAYVAAGFSKGGAKQSASALLKDPMIRAEFERLLQAKYKALHMDVDEILGRAAMLARVNVAALFDEAGNPRPLHEVDEDQTVGIAGVEVQQTTDKKGKVTATLTKVRLRDPMAAIRLLAEHKKLVKNDDAGMNALASAIADRLKLARERRKAKE